MEAYSKDLIVSVDIEEEATEKDSETILCRQFSVPDLILKIVLMASTSVTLLTTGSIIRSFHKVAPY